MTAAADELSAVSPFGSVPTIISCHGFILPEIFLYINSRAILPHTVSVPKLGTSRDIECYTAVTQLILKTIELAVTAFPNGIA